MNIRNTVGGLALAAFAGVYAVAASSLNMTSSLGIGSGLFPMVLAVILCFLGLVVAVQGYVAAPNVDDAEAPPVPLRGIALVTLAPILFAVTVVPLGMVPALAAAVFLGALANKETSLLGAVVVSIVMVVFCVVLFRWGLGLPLALFGPALSFGT